MRLLLCISRRILCMMPKMCILKNIVCVALTLYILLNILCDSHTPYTLQNCMRLAMFLIEYCAWGSLTLHILWKIMRLTCYIFIENCLWGSHIGWTHTCTDSSVVDELKFTSVQLTLWPSCQQLCGILDNLSNVVCEATISMSSPVLCVKLQSECPLQCCVWGVMLV